MDYRHSPGDLPAAFASLQVLRTPAPTLAQLEVRLRDLGAGFAWSRVHPPQSRPDVLAGRPGSRPRLGGFRGKSASSKPRFPRSPTPSNAISTTSKRVAYRKRPSASRANSPSARTASPSRGRSFCYGASIAPGMAGSRARQMTTHVLEKRVLLRQGFSRRAAAANTLPAHAGITMIPLFSRDESCPMFSFAISTMTF